MYRDRDFDLKTPRPPHATELMQDLELEILFGAMAGTDGYLLEAVKVAVLTSLKDLQEIEYRQDVLIDCLQYSPIIREMYAITVAAVEGERRVWRGTLNRYPDRVLYWSIELLHMFLAQLKRLRRIADQHRSKCRSEGLVTLLDMLVRELNDEYLTTVESHLQQLGFRNGISMSAGLGKGNKGTQYVLRRPHRNLPGWARRFQGWLDLLPRKDRTSYVYQLADRDESGANALAELRNKGIAVVASALAQSADHVQSFFGMLRSELAFYIGCLNLRDRLAEKGEPFCVPEPSSAGNAIFSSKALYDVCLSLTTSQRVVGNDVSADNKLLVMITGANRGGKSTGLRSVGQAQLMMQCGMFVAAAAFRASVCAGIYSHFKREEDARMRSGKLEEELSRMSSVIDTLRPNSMVLLNESFASTNAREASEIAQQIVRALLEADVKVVYVTHLFDLAQALYLARMNTSLFLRAERLVDGRRTFRLRVGEPLSTSYGEDLYRHIFDADPDAATAVTAE
jgi:DNA mismatch repair ATPase MutS